MMMRQSPVKCVFFVGVCVLLQRCCFGQVVAATSTDTVSQPLPSTYILSPFFFSSFFLVPKIKYASSSDCVLTLPQSLVPS